MVEIKNHRLFKDGEQITYQKTPNSGGTITPEWLVMHYTAGGSYSGAIKWLCNPVARASAHLVIGFDGSVTQLAPFNVKTWHAGLSSWRGKSGMNSNTIGIELVNKGYGVTAGDETIEARHKNGGPVRKWQVFPEAQIAAALEIAVALRAKYGLTEVIGHDDIAPSRKVDPGPAFDMRYFRGQMFGRDSDGPDGDVEASDDFAMVDTGRIDDPLNMRAWPSLDSQIVEKIPHGSKVMVLRKNPGGHTRWSEIFYNDQKGWVVTRYLADV